jgi:hypothetical protein
MKAHVESLFVLDVAGDMVHANEPGAPTAPRFFLGRTADGPDWWFRHDVDEPTRRELEAAVRADASLVGADEPMPIQPAPYEAILARTQPAQRTSSGLAFSFPEELSAEPDAIPVTPTNAAILTPLLADWLGDVPVCQPMLVLPVDGRAASICASVRLTSVAHQAGVDTSRAHRGRGYAARVVTAWARAVRDIGRIPIYSTSWQNEASRAVARKLQLICFGSDLHIT